MQIKIKSSDGKTEYLIEEYQGEWTCTCPNFNMRKAGQGKNCKHIELVLANQDMLKENKPASVSIVERNNQSIIKPDADDWTPQEFKNMVAREKEMRDILLEYMRSEMKEDHHYYRFKELGKSSLTKDGALNLCSIFKVYPDPILEKVITRDDGYYEIIFKCYLRSLKSNEIKAIGYGSSNNFQTKHRYRYVFDNQVTPQDTVVETITKTGKNGKDYKQCKIINRDVDDQKNTILKMAEKSSIVDAVCKMPLVSELFTQDIEDLPDFKKDKSETQQKTDKLKEMDNKQTGATTPQQPTPTTPATDNFKKNIPQQPKQAQTKKEVKQPTDFQLKKVGELANDLILNDNDVEKITILKGFNLETYNGVYSLIGILTKMLKDEAFKQGIIGEISDVKI